MKIVLKDTNGWYYSGPYTDKYNLPRCGVSENISRAVVFDVLVQNIGDGNSLTVLPELPRGYWLAMPVTLTEV